MLRTTVAVLLRCLLALYTCSVTSGQQFQDDLYRMELLAVTEVMDPGQTAQLQCRRTNSLVQSGSLGGFGQPGSLGGLDHSGVEWVLNARNLLSTTIRNNSCVVTNRDSLGFQTVIPEQLTRFRCLDDGVLVTLFIINMTSIDDATAWQCKHWPLGESDVTVVRVRGPNMRRASVGQLLLTPSGTALVRKGGQLQVECRALSSSPPPTLTWLQQFRQSRPDLPLEASGNSRTTFDLSGGLATTSILYFRPKMSDDGTSILCRALDSDGNVMMTSQPAIITIIVPTTTTAPPPSTTTLSSRSNLITLFSPSPSLFPSPSLTTLSKTDSSIGPGLGDGGERQSTATPSSQGGVVAGIVISIFILIVVSAAILALWIRRRRRKYKNGGRGGRRPRVSVGLGGYMMPDGSVSPSRALPIEHHIYTYLSPDDHAPVHVTTPSSAMQTTPPSGNPNGFCNGAYGVDRSYLRLTCPDPQVGRQLPPIPSEPPDEYDTLPHLPSDDVTAGQKGRRAGTGEHNGERYDNIGRTSCNAVDMDGYEVPTPKADFKSASELQHSRAKFLPDLDVKYVNAQLAPDVSTDEVKDTGPDVNRDADATDRADVHKRADGVRDVGGETVDEIDVEIRDTENDVDWGCVREGEGVEMGGMGPRDASVSGSDDKDRQLRWKKSEVMSTDL